MTQEIQSQGPAWTPEPYSPLSNQTWEQLTEGAATIPGFDLVKDEDTDALVGIPMVLTRVSYRPGISRKGKSNYSDIHPVNAYVSVEARLAPSFDLRKINQARKQSNLPDLTSLDQLPFSPDEHIVFNDGSTGIYRQLVAFLTQAGYIALPEPYVLEGAHGETSLDLTPGEWSEIRAGDAEYDEDEFLTYSADIRLVCKRGLRLSQYEWETQEAKTRYLA
jgi:hypothetical protein